MGRLVEALNACWRPHAAAAAATAADALVSTGPGPADPITLVDFKRDIRERHVWCSSCMIAFEGTEPIGVLIGAKRPTETLVDRIAVRPDRVRKGHGRHMLDSLGSKIAILGPPRLAAEIHDDLPAAAAFFAACGYAPGGMLTDWILDDGAVLAAAVASSAPGGAFAVPVTVADLAANRLLADPPGVAWDRAVATLVARAESLHGLGLATVDRIEAFALYRPTPGGGPGAVIDALGPMAGHTGEDHPDQAESFRRLVAMVLERTGPPLHLPRIAEAELPAEWPKQWGFRAASRRRRYTAAARAG